MQVKGLIVLVRRFADALRDLAPIILVIAFFQVVVIQQPFPNLAGVALGLACVVAGLALFIQGLEQGLFPLGESIAHAFAMKGSAVALLAFAFCLGFGTTVAEPALIAVADKAAEVAAEAGAIADNDAAYDSGGVTTSTITVPLVTALGVGLASSIKGRNPMLDGFGLIAFASLAPMIFVLAYGMVI